MYRIQKSDGTELGYTESLRYIRIGQNGCYTNATKSNAVGVAYQGIAYNLPGHTEIDGETVYVHQFDGGKVLSNIQAENELLEEVVQYVAEAVDVDISDFIKAPDSGDEIVGTAPSDSAEDIT